MGNERNLVEVFTGYRCRKGNRKSQFCSIQCAFTNLLEGTFTPQAIIGLRACSIQRYLETQSLATDGIEFLQARAVEQSCIGENDQLQIFLVGDVINELKNIRAREWLTACKVESLDTALRGLVDDIEQLRCR